VPKICTGIPPSGRPVPGHTRSIVVNGAGVAVGPPGVGVGPPGVAVGVSVGPPGVAVGVGVGPPGVAVGVGVTVGVAGVATVTAIVYILLVVRSGEVISTVIVVVPDAAIAQFDGDAAPGVHAPAVDE
jgi:hypothetical protein